ncbi:MAG: hypothetical protein CO095_12355 [Armatimonadetes bacterium CG_4_9_14_3_um_filter_58_7]|nr:MAG: hypothetical protein CO095_12355 [Armatimonadetes bacterium CG_4_9_14_3_um_filter_58_7]
MKQKDGCAREQRQSKYNGRKVVRWLPVRRLAEVSRFPVPRVRDDVPKEEGDCKSNRDVGQRGEPESQPGQKKAARTV